MTAPRARDLSRICGRNLLPGGRKARTLTGLFPDPLANGNYPAAQTIRAVYARKLIQERESAGLSQSELARRAGVRAETINRLEKGKHSPDAATLTKITKALRAAGLKV